MNPDRAEAAAQLQSIYLFADLDEEQLEQVSAHLVRTVYAPGQVIYRPKDPVDDLYLLVRGQVLLSFGNDAGAPVHARLKAPDVFGIEAIGARRERLTGAIAQTETEVLRLPANRLKRIAEKFPELAITLEWIEHSFLLSLGKPMPWRDPQEAVYLATRHHAMVLLLRLFPALVFTALTVLPTAYLALGPMADMLLPLVLYMVALCISLVWTVWVFIEWGNDHIIITGRRVVFMERVALWYESRQEVPLEAVLACEIVRNQWGRMFGYGNVLARTYTGQVMLRDVPRPEQVVGLINWLRERAREDRESEHRQEVRRRLRQRLGIEPAAPAEEITPAGTAAQRTESVFDWLTNLFRLRSEADGVITYWTHWWMLLRRIWAPTIILGILGFLLAFSLTKASPIDPTIGLLIFFGGGLFVFGWWIYEFFDWRNDRYIIGRDQLVDLYKRPLGTEQRRTAPIRNVQTIEYERDGIIGLLLNFGTVFIRIGNTELTFNHVANPSEVQRELFQRYLDYNQREKLREQEHMEERMAEWIETYHEVTGSDEELADSFGSEAGFG